MKKQNEIQQRRDQLDGQPSNKRFAERDEQWPIHVRWGSVPELTIHHLTDDELESLIRTHDSHCLTWGLSLLSAALAFFIPLVTTTLSHRMFVVFITLMAFCGGAGMPLLLTWLSQRKSTSETVTKIRARFRGAAV